MENKNSPQLELFTQAGGDNQARPRPGGSFLSCIRAYEKTLLIVIGFIICSIAAFSIGVERGKRLAVSQNNIRFDTALIKKPPRQIMPPKAIQGLKTSGRPQGAPLQSVMPNVGAGLVPALQPRIQPQQKQDAPAPLKANDLFQNYTIQLASYKSRAYAQKETEALQKKGLSPLIIPKGNYVILCVGKFSDKESARVLLARLGKLYRDCFIRRI